MRMLNHLLAQIGEWRSSMPRVRSYHALRDLSLALLANDSKRSTLTAAFQERGGDRETKAAFANRCYHILERVKSWKAEDLFKPVLAGCLAQVSDLAGADEPVVIALDDTSLPKAGTKIHEAGYYRDPLGMKFRVNFKWGIRCIHAAFLLPYQEVTGRPWAVTVAFDVAPPAKKPTKFDLKPLNEAEQEQLWEDYKHAQKACSLTTKGVAVIQRLRTWLDELGHRQKRILMVVDGSYTNQNIIPHLPPRVDLVGRCRRNAELYMPYDGKRGNRVYGDRLTPEGIERDHERFPMRIASLVYGGETRDIRYKDVPQVLWKLGTGRQRMRALIVMPIPYRLRNGRLAYNKTAYLLTTDLTTPAETLVKHYLARWEIEVLHRNLKREGMGVGDPQCWKPHTVGRIHTAFVAAYASLNLAVLQAHGSVRHERVYGVHDPWRNDGANRRRPSHRDIVMLLRRELDEAGYWKNPPRRRRKPAPPLKPAA